MSYQDWVRIALEMINLIVDLVDVINDPKNMVWPKEGAYYINPMLRELLEKNPNLYTGCLVYDYIDSFLARAIYMTNFGSSGSGLQTRKEQVQRTCSLLVCMREMGLSPYSLYLQGIREIYNLMYNT